MPFLYDSVDLQFSFRGDFVLDERHDLQDTSDDLLWSLQNEIMTVANSSSSDWELYPGLGADLDEFVGESNSREQADRLKRRLVYQLTSGPTRLVNQSDLDIEVVPISNTAVVVLLAVSAQATDRNALSTASPRRVTRLIFDYSEHGVIEPNGEL